MTEHEPVYSLYNFNLLTSLLAVLNRNDVEGPQAILAHYLLSHLHDLNELNIYDVAADCYVSRSSIQRFAKSLGYRGFADLKQQHAAIRSHYDRFAAYTNHPNFAHYLSDQMTGMISDVSAMAQAQGLAWLVDQIDRAGQVCVLHARTSSTGVEEFQEGMLTAGKLVHIAIDSVESIRLLQGLGPQDLLITASATGNFALASLDDLRPLHSRKVLVTLNRSSRLLEVYDRIFYLSATEYDSDAVSSIGLRNVYTRYGLSFFFDLLFHEYAVRHFDRGDAT